MSFDTAAKRSSALDHEEIWAFGIPAATGAFDQAARQHALWSYSGLLVGEAVVPVDEADETGGSFPRTQTGRGLRRPEVGRGFRRGQAGRGWRRRDG